MAYESSGWNMAGGNWWGKLRRRVKRMGDKHHGVLHPLITSGIVVGLMGVTIALAVYAVEIK